ncbi:MAG TPA: sulfurtransferase TusA family protein [Propionibacteriaceae bacterium]|nr:sulfurtransferase TusA family protein [Propionibacteriaceae bacterium]
MTEQPSIRLDCRGQRCPRPIIELARQIRNVAVGGLVEVLADDPAAGPDLAAWCRMRGHVLVINDAPKFAVRRLT